MALGALAGDAVGEVVDQARAMHEEIAQHVFKAVGPGAGPVKFVHDRVARTAYVAVRGGVVGVVRTGARAASARAPDDAPSIEQSTAGRVVVGALNGAIGDTLERRGSPLALTMTLRRLTHEVGTSKQALAKAFPDAASRLAVFVHGACETDDAWRLGDSRHVPYGFRLQTELGYTPLYIRYNTGRHVSENGRELAQVLERVSANWPVHAHEIALIGHSMGGLVARSACHYAGQSEWTGKVRHMFMLGAPHRGAPLERLANVVSSALALRSETRALARGLNARSAGIKDLRFGYLLDEDWLDQDPDAFLRNTGGEIPFPATANHYFVCATLSREPHAPVGRMIGDLLVLRASAWGGVRRGERMRFPIEHYHHVGPASHFDLLNHPAIYDQLRRWLSSRRALPAGTAADRR